MRFHLTRTQVIWPEASNHPRLTQLRYISDFLFDCRQLEALVLLDLLKGSDSTKGRPGMPAQQLIRCLVLMRLHDLSYRELEFALQDSISTRAFCLVGKLSSAPKRTTLCDNIKLLRAATLEELNRCLVSAAQQLGLEDGLSSRLDCTVTLTNIHYPTDGSLLWDVIRVLNRLLQRVHQLVPIEYHDHQRRAKKALFKLEHARTQKKKRKWREVLLEVGQQTIEYATDGFDELYQRISEFPLQRHEKIYGLLGELDLILGLGERILDVAKRRIREGEKVPSEEKVLSLFEAHTQLIATHSDVKFGHKFCLNGGKQLILDCVFDADGGVPVDVDLTVPMVERHQKLMGYVPDEVTFDGAFHSQQNVKELKALGVKEVAPSKTRGMSIDELCSSKKIYQRLKRWRAGVEGSISWLKRSFGLRKCRWRSLESFKCYVWSAIFTANLVKLAQFLHQQGASYAP